MFNQPPKFDELFASIAESNKKWFENLTSATKAQNEGQDNQLLDTFKSFFDNTKSYLETQNSFYQEQLQSLSKIMQGGSEAAEVPATGKRPMIDRRFSDPDWQKNPFFAYIRQSYDNFSKHMHDFVNKTESDEDTKSRMKFFLQQYIDAIAPSNFAVTNPEVIKAMMESNGQSIADGMKNMLEDMQNGYIAMTDESAFEVGKNLAATEGAVIFRNELIELIHYKPTTEKVYEVPLVIVPPCINKYYILDLQQDNSMVKYYVDQGYNVYLISWKSADSSIKNFRWEEYVNLGVIKAIEVVREVTKKPKVNTIGYCVGGAILTSAGILLKSREQDWINSMLHMTTMLDYSDPGEIKVFLDENLQKAKIAKKDIGGVVSGRMISQTFSALRPNDLIWNYWVNNYLLGKTPQKFDILYWNSDIVDLPLPMHYFYLDNLYFNNNFAKGEFVVDGVTMDLSKIDYPVYLFAAQKDHIVPWESAYKSAALLPNAQVKFVLGASGHTAGVVNPANTDKRNYWVNDNLPTDAKEWFKTSTSMPGSWWKDANEWLITQSGKQIKAPSLGTKEYPVLCEAPGDYVKAKGLSIMEAEAI